MIIYFVGRMGKLVGNAVEKRRRSLEKAGRMLDNRGRRKYKE